MKSPWFLVDGYFIFNDSLIYHLPFNELRQVDLYNTNESILKYFDPIMIQGGVVAVYTHNNSLAEHINSQPNTLVVKGLDTDDDTAFNKFPVSSDLSDQKPDLNPLIYWNPEIHFSANGMTELEIPANDVSGNYLIQIEGMDTDGKPFFGRKVIPVIP
jgi:hypothetical protein